ncbi:hypothetical protein AMATHDRAFT_6396 [Amanita thiersii Skay4041]|uniref:Spindle pole body component n=1 Tax=Amanita thiersii Skay4041 TaxID=703135 RepID=A0A2A9NJB3_9AGAR|nr:hypothetical protein AMATHDRAFT_6396 [Amanita thiersii Skay4041]
MPPSTSHLERRPASSASLRPPSSASIQRPSSSLSLRPRSSSSAVSTSRPQSRVARRPSSRHGNRQRLFPLAQALITQITGLSEKGTPNDPDGEQFRAAVEFVVKNLETTTVNKGAVSVDMKVMDEQIHGHAFKARINSNDALSEAILAAYKKIKTSAAQNKDLDKEIKMYRLPDHLQLLVQLSRPPSASTLAFAEHYVHELKNPPPAPKSLTWADILAEEPFEGEHWEGVYGLPPGSIRGNTNGATTDDWDSTPSLSPLESDLELDDAELTDSPSAPDIIGLPSHDEKRKPIVEEVIGQRLRPKFHTDADKQALENMKTRQYWREDWKSDANIEKEFDLKDTSTLGPMLNRLHPQPTSKYNYYMSKDAPLYHERYISEYDAVREVFMALEGRNNMLFCWKDDTYKTTSSTPRLAHLSIASQNSILTSLAQLASTIQTLRYFCSKVLANTHHPSFENGTGLSTVTISRTIEAFADAVDAEVRNFDSWCASQEEDMCRALNGVYSDDEPSTGLVVSLLHTEKSVRDKFGVAFDVLLNVIRNVVPEMVQPEGVDRRHSVRHRTKSPAVVMAALMDTLFVRVQEHIERGEEADIETGSVLMRVLVQAVEPVWDMIGNWLRDGMGLGLGTGAANEGSLDDEFFIESSGLGVGMMGMGLLDPDFWRDGYSLREGAELSITEHAKQGTTMKAIPMFLEHVAEPVLSAGKAVGLLRALGISSSMDGQDQWSSFNSLVGSEGTSFEPRQSENMALKPVERLFSVSVDTLSRLIYDALAPRCDAAGALLAKVLVEDCNLWGHLGAIEDLFFMRRGDAMSHFTDLVFAKMDIQQSWGDFHFLNTAFADVVAASISTGHQAQWIRPSLVRLSYRNNGNRERERSIEVTVKALDSLSVDYAVPFPLTYIFQPRVVQLYCDIFIFLMQIKRAKTTLERILVRGSAAGYELKPFYAMRSRLSWFVNTFLNFLTTNAIHTEVLVFHDKLRNAKSLDEVIQLHQVHLERVYYQCFLDSKTSNLYRAILSIMDMSIHFSGLFVAFAGDTTMTHDVSRQSISMRRHRSRRLKRQRRNVIGFAQFLNDVEYSSSSNDDDGDDVEDVGVPETSVSMIASSVSIAEGNSMMHLDKLSGELDELVRFVRRGVETLANNSAEVSSSVFGILAFALEDWDL